MKTIVLTLSCPKCKQMETVEWPAADRASAQRIRSGFTLADGHGAPVFMCNRCKKPAVEKTTPH